MSASLEEAIRMAKKAAFNTDNDHMEFSRNTTSTKHGSRNRDGAGTGIALVTKGSNIGNGFFDDAPNSEAVFWKSKFEEVQKLRIEAEEDILKVTRTHKEREDCLESYVKLLNQKISNLERGGAKMSNEENSKEIKELETIVSNHRHLLDFYEMLTGVVARPSSNSDGMVCTLKNTMERKATRFTLSEAENGELDFTPEANIDMLPDFLQSEIQFAKEMAPAMLANALSHLYDNGETDEAETETMEGGEQ